MARETTDGLYIELGYLTPEEYYAYVAEAEGLLSNYIDSGYIAQDYYEGQGAFATISCELTEFVGVTHDASASISAAFSISNTDNTFGTNGAEPNVVVDGEITLSVSASQSTLAGTIKQGDVDITGAFSATLTAIGYKNMTAIMDTTASLSASVVLTADANITLSNIVNISLQADRTRGIDTALSASFGTTTGTARTRIFDSSLAVSFDTSINGIKAVEAETSASSAFSLSCDAEKVIYIEFSASLSSTFALTANAIEYQLRSCDRPWTATYSDINSYNNYDPSYFGSYNANFDYIQYENIDSLVLDNDNEYVVEFWKDRQLSSTAIYVSSDTSLPNSPTLGTRNFRLAGHSLNELTAYVAFDDASASYLTYNKDTDWDDNTGGAAGEGWNHILVMIKPGSGGKLFVNGVLKDSYSSTKDIVALDPTDDHYLSLGRPYNWPAINTTAWQVMSEFRILKSSTAIQDAGYNWTDTSITVPSSAFTNNSSTQLLLHFENNLNDDATGCVPPRETFSVSASLTAQASISVDTDKIAGFASLVASAGSLTANANVITDTSASIEAVANISNVLTGFLKDANIDTDAIASTISVAYRVADFFIDCDTSASLSTDVNAVRSATSSLSSQFTTSISVNEIVQLQADLSATATASADPTGSIIRTTAALSSVFTLSATGLRIQPLEADPSANATLTAAPIKAVEAEANVNYVATAVIDGIRIRYANIDTEAIASSLTAAAKIGDYLVDIPVSATLSVEGNVLGAGSVSIEALAETSAIPSVTRTNSASFDAIFTQQAEAVAGIAGEADLTLQATTSTDAVKVTEAVISINGAAQFTTSVNATRVGDIDLYITANQSTSASRFRKTDATFITSATLSLTAGVLKEGDSTQTAQFTSTADGRIIVFLEELTHTVPSENRTWSTYDENREYTITNEVREVTLY